jgi:hypothetical protein
LTNFTLHNYNKSDPAVLQVNDVYFYTDEKPLEKSLSFVHNSITYHSISSVSTIIICIVLYLLWKNRINIFKVAKRKEQITLEEKDSKGIWPFREKDYLAK